LDYVRAIYPLGRGVSRSAEIELVRVQGCPAFSLTDHNVAFMSASQSSTAKIPAKITMQLFCARQKQRSCHPHRAAE
jgi:hypothetical protein